MVDSNRIMISLIKDEEKIRDAKEIDRMYSDLVSLLSRGFKIEIHGLALLM